MPGSGGVHWSWVCLELPGGRQQGASTAGLILSDRHWEMGRQWRGGINYACPDVSHQSKLKLLFGNGCVRGEARISPPFLVQTVE